MRQVLLKLGFRASLTNIQNEKKKDKDLTERIEWILKKRDDVVKGVDISSLNLPSFLRLTDKSLEQCERSVDRFVSIQPMSLRTSLNTHSSPS